MILIYSLNEDASLGPLKSSRIIDFRQSSFFIEAFEKNFSSPTSVFITLARIEITFTGIKLLSEVRSPMKNACPFPQ